MEFPWGWEAPPVMEFHLYKHVIFHGRRRGVMAMVLGKQKVLNQQLDQPQLPIIDSSSSSSHNHGSGEWFPPRLVSFAIDPFSTSIVMEGS